CADRLRREYRSHYVEIRQDGGPGLCLRTKPSLLFRIVEAFFADAERRVLQQGGDGQELQARAGNTKNTREMGRVRYIDRFDSNAKPTSRGSLQGLNRVHRPE